MPPRTRTTRNRRNRVVKPIRTGRARVAEDSKRPLDPWELVWGQPYIDSETLAAALESDLQQTPDPDFRTRLLVRDAARAIRSFWGGKRFARWLAGSPVGERIRTILREDLGKPGFRYIRRRLVANVNLTDIKQVFQLLSQRVHGRVEIDIAGSIPTLIRGLTARPTDDIDIVNEVPAEIRQQRETLQKIKTDFGLTLGHVQSHYLPANWQQRRQYLGEWGHLRVYCVDAYDIFVSKLSSKQEKHKQDLRVMAKKLDQEIAKQRLLGDGNFFLADPFLKPQIEANWQFIYQEPLFPEAGEGGGQEVKRGEGNSTEATKKNRRKKEP